MAAITSTTTRLNFADEHTVILGVGFGVDTGQRVAFGFVASHVRLRLKLGAGPVFVSWTGRDGDSEIELETGEREELVGHGRSFVYLRSVAGGEILQIDAQRNALEHSV